jgi:hypothetical protein
LLLSGLLGLLLLGIAYLILKDIQKAGLVTSIVEVLLFSYGHIYNLVKPLTILGRPIGRHRYLLPILLLVTALLIWRVIKSSSDKGSLSLLINVVTVVLFAFQLIQISFFEIKLYRNQRQTVELTEQTQGMVFEGEKRDIYILLLDAYRRSDWLLESTEYDNSDFLQNLEELGFVIAPCSRSNYSYTLLSMTSELNMAYLDTLFDPISDIETSNLIKHSEVRHIVEDLGYKTIFFQNYYPRVDIDDGDYYIKPKDVFTYDPFKVLFMQTTILTIPFDLLEQQAAETSWSPEHADLNRQAMLVQSIFEFLQMPHGYDAPVFVYAHILSPHSPRVFNADGSINYEWEQSGNDSFFNTYQYLDNETIKTIEAILANSDPEPIIILQSDHGDGDGSYRNLTLNAFYLPDGGDEMIYPTITPVNFFRIIFNTYFDMDFDLLEDKSYYSEELNRYNLEEVQDPYDYCRDLNQ